MSYGFPCEGVFIIVEDVFLFVGAERAYGYEQSVFTLIVLFLCHLKLLNTVKSNIKWKTNNILY